MALEVKVYKNVDDFKPKLFFGMTWRQLIIMVPLCVVAVVWSTLGAATLPDNIDFVARWWPPIKSVPKGLAQAPITDLGQFVVIAGVGVAAAFGWWRPMRIDLEVVAAAAWRHYQRPRLQTLGGKNHDSSSGARHVPTEVFDAKSWSKSVVKINRKAAQLNVGEAEAEREPAVVAVDAGDAGLQGAVG